MYTAYLVLPGLEPLGFTSGIPWKMRRLTKKHDSTHHIPLDQARLFLVQDTWLEKERQKPEFMAAKSLDQVIPGFIPDIRPS